MCSVLSFPFSLSSFPGYAVKMHFSRANPWLNLRQFISDEIEEEFNVDLFLIYSFFLLETIRNKLRDLLKGDKTFEHHCYFSSEE